MFKKYLRYRGIAITYFKHHPEYNALVHALGGIAIGILIAEPLIFPHPIRWALIFAGLGIAGHLYTLVAKK